MARVLSDHMSGLPEKAEDFYYDNQPEELRYGFVNSNMAFESIMLQLEEINDPKITELVCSLIKFVKLKLN